MEGRRPKPTQRVVMSRRPSRSSLSKGRANIDSLLDILLDIARADSRAAACSSAASHLMASFPRWPRSALAFKRRDRPTFRRAAVSSSQLVL